LNRMLGDVTLVVEKRKPFDELAKRLLVTSSRGNQTRLELFGSQFDDWLTVVMELLLDAA